MTLRIFCDGCDDKLDVRHVTLTAETTRSTTILPFSGGERKFHWCGTCAGKILEYTHNLRKGEKKSGT